MEKSDAAPRPTAPPQDADQGNPPARQAETPQALVRGARAAMRAGDWSHALALWNRCLEAFDDGHQPWWHSALANVLMALGRLDEAADLLDGLVQGHPDYSPAYADLAKLAQSRGDWRLAAKRWKTCIQRFDDGQRPWWHNGLAHALIQCGELDAAERVLQELLDTHPDFPPVQGMLATLAQRQEDWPLASRRWEDCIRRFPDQIQPGWLSQYATALMEQARYDQARAMLQRLIRDYPEAAAGHLGLAQLAVRQQDWVSAERLWAECIRRFDDGKHFAWHKQHAHALLNLERHTEALGVFTRLDRAGEADAAVLNGLAKCSFLGQDMNACLDYARRLVDRYPKLPSGHHWSEQALIRLGRFREAADAHLARPDNRPRAPAQEPELPDNYPPDLVLPEVLGNGNDYGFIETRLEGLRAGGEPHDLPVSIIIPVYNRSRLLAKTLAALTHQTYPRHLIEVVVADDGSQDRVDAVIDRYRPLLNLRWVRQEDRGFRLAAVRNLGIAAASHDHLVLLDCDILPLAHTVESFMEYFQVSDQAVLTGMRAFVSSDGVSDEDILESPTLLGSLPRITPRNSVADIQIVDGSCVDWREPFYVRSRNLKDSLFPFWAFSGGIAAMPRSALRAAGGFDESFRAWGGEDTELAYRLYIQGYYFIPVATAVGLHQEPSAQRGDQQADRIAGRESNRELLRQKLPLSPDRRPDPPAPYSVPKVSIYIPAHNAAGFIEEAVNSALGQSFKDLEVVICDDGSTDHTLALLRRLYGAEPRVRWFSQAHRGIAAATNRAVSACRGMYIGQLDADDALEPTAVQSMVDYLDNNDVGYAYSGLCRVDQQDRPRRNTLPLAFSRRHLLTTMICSAFRMFRKRDWNRTQGCDETLSNAVDYDLALKFSEVCRIYHVPRMNYRYRIHGANTTLVNREAQERNHLAAINRALQRMGLSQTWRAVQGPATNRRLVRFERLRTGAEAAQAPAPPDRTGHPKVQGTVFIAGSGRSGTTWLMELLDYDDSKRLLFEPFDSRQVALFKGWKRHQYLRPEALGDSRLADIHRVLSGDIKDPWIDAHSKTDNPGRRIVKDIRAQLLLKCIKRHFPEVPIIMLMRHPCAVASSRTHLNWPADPAEYLSQGDLVADFLAPYRQLLEAARDPFEGHLLSWCVENLVPLKQFAPGEMLVIFYEHLCRHPQREIRRLFSYLGWVYSPRVDAAIKRPSRLSRGHSAVLNQTDPVEFWRNGVSEAQIERAQEICARFGMQAIYGRGGMPLLRPAEVLERFGP